MNPGLVGDGGAGVSSGWKALVSLGVSVLVSAGAGAEATLKITYEGGRFMFRCEARLVLGVGAKGGISGSVDFNKVLELIMYIFNQLKDNNFAFLHFVTEGAYQALVRISLIVIEYGADALAAAGDQMERLMRSIIQPFERADAAEAYARKIQSRPTALIFASPEAKGVVLYKLSERFTFSFEERQEAAILTVVGTMQNRREWEQVVERISKTGQKTSAAAGLARLRAVLDGGSAQKFETMIRAINSLPSITKVAGGPVIVRNLA